MVSSLGVAVGIWPLAVGKVVVGVVLAERLAAVEAFVDVVALVLGVAHYLMLLLTIRGRCLLEADITIVGGGRSAVSAISVFLSSVVAGFVIAVILNNFIRVMWRGTKRLHVFDSVQILIIFLVEDTALLSIFLQSLVNLGQLILLKMLRGAR